MAKLAQNARRAAEADQVLSELLGNLVGQVADLQERVSQLEEPAAGGRRPIKKTSAPSAAGE